MCVGMFTSAAAEELSRAAAVAPGLRKLDPQLWTRIQEVGVGGGEHSSFAVV